APTLVLVIARLDRAMTAKSVCQRRRSETGQEQKTRSKLPCSTARCLSLPVRYLHLEQRRAQRLAVRIERQRPRHAAAERLMQDEVEGADAGQLVALGGPTRNVGEMRLHTLGGDVFGKEGVVARLVGDHRDVGHISLVAAA